MSIDPELESAMRETMSRHGMTAPDQEAVCLWFRQHDGEAREEVLLQAVDDGFLEIVAFREGYGPVYYMADF